MQQLTTPPRMSSPTPSMTAGVPYAPPPQPRLGTPIPGTTGGLPALSGLSVYQNPMAQQLQSMGRGDDKMLVHMTPGEVQSLRGLAQLTGGDLTTNPNTGLPEAGWLGNLLPTILGGLASLIPGVAPWMIGLAGTVGGTAATGNLGKGLMMGLGAFGGASLGGAIKGALGSTASSAAPAAGVGGGAGGVAGGATGTATGVTSATASEVATKTAEEVAKQAAEKAATSGAQAATPNIIRETGGNLINVGAPAALPENLISEVIGKAGGNAAEAAATQTVTKAPGFFNLFGDASRYGGKGIAPLSGMLGKAAPYAAGLGLVGNVAEAFKPGPAKDEEEKTNFPYEGPYYSERKQIARMPIDLRGPNPSGQQQYFEPIRFYKRSGEQFTPGTPTTPAVPYYAAKGGELGMDEGSFIFPARETAELGNGSSRAGQEVLARMGGRPIDGKGDGVSDSIPARIGGKQEARVARDEVYFSPQAVARIGGGDHSRGTKKLYALMDRAKKARQRAAVGADTKLRRGIV